MNIFQIDDKAQLYISPSIDDWKAVEDNNITVVFDLDYDLDIGIPTIPNELIYLYFPFDDNHLPDLHRLHQIAHMGAKMIQADHRVLAHCGMGINRSALLAGIILTHLGMPGKDALNLIRQKREGALYNQHFSTYLETLMAIEQQDL